MPHVKGGTTPATRGGARYELAVWSLNGAYLAKSHILRRFHEDFGGLVEGAEALPEASARRFTLAEAVAWGLGHGAWCFSVE